MILIHLFLSYLNLKEYSNNYNDEYRDDYEDDDVTTSSSKSISNMTHNKFSFTASTTTKAPINKSLKASSDDALKSSTFPASLHSPSSTTLPKNNFQSTLNPQRSTTKKNVPSQLVTNHEKQEKPIRKRRESNSQLGARQQNANDKNKNEKNSEKMLRLPTKRRLERVGGNNAIKTTLRMMP